MHVVALVDRPGFSSVFVECTACGCNGPSCDAVEADNPQRMAVELWNRGLLRPQDSRAEFGRLCEQRAALETLVRSLLLAIQHQRITEPRAHHEPMRPPSLARSSGAWWGSQMPTEEAAREWLQENGLLS